MAAACKRLAQFSGFGFSKSFTFNSSLRSFPRMAKSNGRRFYDASTITSRLEEQGVSTKQAQAISAGITEVLEKVQESLMERTEMLQESNESKFKTEVQRSQLQREIEKLRNDMEKNNSELRLARLAIHRAEIAFKAQILTTERVIRAYCLGTIFTCAVAFLSFS
ncbi:uncharacterized protein [Arachis hypogaea]|uniref:uncharacterized protein isoform X2 n=1 Tax=Arachis hypogaea TaxID=3818 RepID=UPI000DEC1D90|nr:uncharacterized protein LOC112749559 isoform X2 [Arachis hypogaea]